MRYCNPRYARLTSNWRATVRIRGPGRGYGGFGGPGNGNQDSTSGVAIAGTLAGSPAANADLTEGAGV